MQGKNVLVLKDNIINKADITIIVKAVIKDVIIRAADIITVADTTTTVKAVTKDVITKAADIITVADITTTVRAVTTAEDLITTEDLSKAGLTVEDLVTDVR